mgnify:CR=1 FL=1
MGRGARRGGGRGGGAGRGQGQGPGRMGGSAAGLGGECVCPACGHREPHIPGQPCTAKQCSKCGTRMIRE